MQREYAKGVLSPYGNSHRARRRVPLAAKALVAIEQLPPRVDTGLLVPAPRAATLRSATGAHGLGTRHWRRPGSPSVAYHLRHTFATEALAAGVSTFELSRLMGTSIAVIDRHYGHLARDSEDSIRARLDARSIVLASSGVRRRAVRLTLWPPA